MPDPLAFLRTRWRGQVSLRLMVWRDMAAAGTVINLLASFTALMLAAQGADTAVVLAAHLAPTPYNLFLVGAIWRSPHCRVSHATAAGLWLVLMTVA